MGHFGGPTCIPGKIEWSGVNQAESGPRCFDGEGGWTGSRTEWGLAGFVVRTYANSGQGGESWHQKSPHNYWMSQSLPRFLSIHVGKIRRHKGDSFPGQVAYINRAIGINPRTGQRYDFRKKGSAEATGLAGWNGTVDELSACAVFSEQRQKAVEGRGLIIALPHELGRDERRRLVAEIAESLVKKFQVATAYAIHPPSDEGDQRNWHAHILMTSRRVVAGTSLGHKTRELDDLKTGGDHIEAIRVMVCTAMNTALRHAGYPETIEHKSFARLGINQQPSRHKGEKHTAINRMIDRQRLHYLPPHLRSPGQILRPISIPSVPDLPTPTITMSAGAALKEVANPKLIVPEPSGDLFTQMLLMRQGREMPPCPMPNIRKPELSQEPE